MSIEVTVTGGLGNQLFCYAVGLELSMKHECELILSVGDLGHRSCELRGMNLTSRVRWAQSRSPIRTRILRTFGGLPGIGPYCFEKHFYFDEDVLELRPPAKLFGYFQSWRYSPNVRPLILEQLRSFSNPSEAFILWQERLADTEFVAVQIRRGDYLAHSDYHGVCSDRYFDEALGRVLDWQGPIVVFTDDQSDWAPAWAEERGAVIVRPGDVSDPRESLALMGMGTHFVISNSSFGWWGAELGQAASKIVVAPRPWFGVSHLDTRDLLPLEWQTLDMREQ